MSARAAPPVLNRRPIGFAKFFLAIGLLSCPMAAIAALYPDDRLDDKSPLPPGDAKKALLALKFQIANKDRMIFQGQRDSKTGRQVGGITDLTSIAKETENADEYRAWHEVVQHAAQFAATDLEEYAGRELTRDDLIGSPRFTYRLDLLRFDGKLTRLRRLAASKSLQEVGTKEVFEALVVPLGQAPSEAVSVVFTELPEGLESVKKAEEGQWLEIDKWVVAAGYFFKVKLDAPKDIAIPVLIGKSVRLLKAPPAGPDPKNPAALDKNLRVFKYIRDNAPIAKGEESWEEADAWNRILLHARRFTPEELDELARTDVTFADLFKDVRRDYKLDLVKFEGRLISLKKLEPSKKLREAGVETVYEGWIVPKDEPRGNPISVVFTDPPEGVEPSGRVNKWVTFAGYSFKLLQYESGEKDKDDPKKNVWKRAPLLLGRAVVIRPDPDGTTAVSWQSFVTIATGVVLGLIGVSLGLSYWFRRGDKRAKREIEANRAPNPFGEPAN